MINHIFSDPACPLVTPGTWVVAQHTCAHTYPPLLAKVLLTVVAKDGTNGYCRP